MVRTSRVAVIACCVALTAVTHTSAGADIGPVPGGDLPCISTIAPLTNCPQSSPQQDHAQAQGPASAQAVQSLPDAKPFSVSSTPSLARALLAEVNRTRRANGLLALTYSPRLAKAGTAHAQALAAAGQFTHTWPTNGRVFGSWIRGFYPARGYRVWSTGENLLWASPGFEPAKAVQQWLNSPTHRRVMLTPSWRELGVGVVSAGSAPGMYGGRDVQIAAAEFGKRKA